MEESLNQSPILIPRDNIRSIQSDIKAQLDNYEIGISDATFFETSKACDCVREQVLNYEDEPHLTKSQNNCRRIFIASELLINICSVYWDAVDFEFSKAINDLLQRDKYKTISEEIRQKIQSESRGEKYFAKEALKKLKEADLTNSKMVSQDSLELENREIEREFVTSYERETPPVGQQSVDALESGVPHSQSNEVLEELSDILEHLTTMRDEPVTDTSRQQFHISSVSRQDLQVPDTAVETSIQEPEIREKYYESLREIREILEDQILPPDVDAIEKPETLLDSLDFHTDGAAIEERPPDNGKQAISSERSEEWSLPVLEAIESARKRRRLIIDKETIIHQYAERAMRLNRNINTQRVEVFQGPPQILQAFSASYLLKTPAFKSTSMFRNIRSSELSTLYNRHLTTETKEVEPILFERRAVEERHEISKPRINQEVVDYVGVKVGLHSAPEKTDILAEIAPKKSRVEDSVPLHEATIGMPMSRIINSIIPPLEETQLERINIASLSPKVQHVQGQSIDSKTTPSWFLSTKVNSPSARFREFKYVSEKIQNYWLAFEDERKEKCITLNEFLSLESEESNANFLTVLRIIDKMSIQRKLKLVYKDGDVFIRPFEGPHFSNGQSLLQIAE